MFPKAKFVSTHGIRMAVFEQGEGPAVIMVHGFPELAYSWRHQLPALADAGFRAIAPDMRGYGQTDGPSGVDAYRMSELIGDLIGLLDALELQNAVFVGHDMGAIVLWQMAMLVPERIGKMVILNIPHIPRYSVDPVSLMRGRQGDDFYIVNFQDSDEADRAFNADPGHFIDVMMRKKQIRRAQFEQLPAQMKVLSLLNTMARSEPSGQPLLTAPERAYYVDAFSKNGFTNPINWYRNWTANWEALEGVDQTIKVPTLFIGAVDDVVIAPEQIDAMLPWVTDLTTVMLEPCGHWSQQERPDDVNRLIIEWLADPLKKAPKTR